MTNKTWVKVCGVTRLEDALAAAACGVDAIGFNFCSSSFRYVGISAATSIVMQLPDSLIKVGVFVNAETNFIDRVLTEVDLDLIQFHGTEKRETCAAFGVPYIKAIGATGLDEIRIAASNYKDARAILLDTVSEGKLGGTGSVFDWHIIPELDIPLILAGGLNPGNVADAIFQAKPCVVDVASGVESSHGIKDRALMWEFVSSVQRADRGR